MCSCSQQEKPVYGFVKRGQSLWEPLWSEDEKTCARACNAEVQFFEDNDFSTVAKRWVIDCFQLISLDPKKLTKPVFSK